MELFTEKQFVSFSPELFSLSFTFSKVPSKIFDIALNTPLSFKDSIYFTIYMTVEHFISHLRDSSEHKYASEKVKQELRVANYKFQSTSYEFKYTS